MSVSCKKPSVNRPERGGGELRRGAAASPQAPFTAAKLVPTTMLSCSTMLVPVLDLER